ncbi:hypothetical protein BCE_0366 [Bacillus cereus ATCC 10987]|uniref:Uncharacterized protein n=1 Tax=Bacillus cereus (strain ATCC 10987 / NRS 248) TaxID=222523 RepID=Q73EJ2_BACC1|nr:hypothetical protein BCE_0366 [Bacillus cereus ATCC 10987]
MEEQMLPFTKSTMSSTLWISMYKQSSYFAFSTK